VPRGRAHAARARPGAGDRPPTDDARIAEATAATGAEAVLTRADPPERTDRLAEVARTLDAAIVVNVQGDLPLLDPAMVEGLIARMTAEPSLPMATLATALRDEADWRSPHVVKVVVGAGGRRSTSRAVRSRMTGTAGARQARPSGWRHIGMYAYRRDVLLRLAALSPSPLERREQLEQLRALRTASRSGGRVDGDEPLIEVDTRRTSSGRGRRWNGAGADDQNGKTKFIFVTGGVVSSLGKGRGSASIGALLEARGLKVTLVKMDPYINVDPGTMSPFQHGEVFVTDDVRRPDRISATTSATSRPGWASRNNFTTGQVTTRSGKERRGDYLGGTVQVIRTSPTRSSAASRGRRGRERLHRRSGRHGGHIEACPSSRRSASSAGTWGAEHVYVHLTLVPFHPDRGELKTKPTQHSVKELTGLGHPARPAPLPRRQAAEKKVKARSPSSARGGGERHQPRPNVETIYEVPLVFHAEGLDERIVEKLNIFTGSPTWKWRDRLDHQEPERRRSTSRWSASTST